jgi:phosphoserine phosphatase
MTSHVLVLTASRALDAADAEPARIELGATAGDMRRLGQTALEIPFRAEGAAALKAQRAVRRALHGAGIDANVVRSVGRRKRLLIADMDSTIIGVECIDEIADFAGVKPQVAEITERAMRGELDFEGALIERVGLLRDLSETALQQTFDERVRLNPGALALVRTMNAMGAMTALVSGGFTFFSTRVAEAAGFQYHQANTLLIEDGRLTGEVAEPILGREAKLEALKRLCAERGFTPDEAVAVGDGANDLAMLGAAGLGVAYRAKPAVAEAAAARLDHSDLTAILHLQGIRTEAFRT